MRFFQKAIRRSGINASYTEGFSPHLKLSFAQPLSVGVETDGDYFDLEMDSLPDLDTLVGEMNRQCVDGIEVLCVTLLDEDVQNGMSSVKAADYIYTFDKLDAEDEALLKDFFSQDTYIFEYIRKDKPKVKDLMEDIYGYEILGDNRLLVKVNSSSAGNLKADVVTEALEKYGLESKCLVFKRHELYTAGKDGAFLSLKDCGEVYF